MANNTSQHILSTSANLLGFCLFVITSLHMADKSEGSIIDEFTSFVAVLLAISCFYSFMSIRTTYPLRELRYENYAEYLFIISLVCIILIIILITLNFIK